MSCKTLASPMIGCHWPLFSYKPTHKRRLLSPNLAKKRDSFSSAKLPTTDDHRSSPLSLGASEMIGLFLGVADREKTLRAITWWCYNNKHSTIIASCPRQMCGVRSNSSQLCGWTYELIRYRHQPLHRISNPFNNTTLSSAQADLRISWSHSKQLVILPRLKQNYCKLQILTSSQSYQACL